MSKELSSSLRSGGLTLSQILHRAQGAKPKAPPASASDHLYAEAERLLPKARLDSLRHDDLRLRHLRPGTQAMPELGLKTHSSSLRKPHDLSFNSSRTLSSRAKSDTDLLLDENMRLRKETALDHSVEVLMRVMDAEKKPSIYFLPALPSAHRHVESTSIPEPKLRRKIIRMLRKYEICDVYDLLRVSAEDWSEIGRELGGVTHADVKTQVLSYLGHLNPVDRAAFWAAAGSRQRPAEHFRSVQFPTTRPPRWLKNPDSCYEGRPAHALFEVTGTADAGFFP